MLVVRIRNAGRRGRQRAGLAAAIGGLDVLNAPFDLAHVVQVVGEARAVGGADLPLEAVERRRDRIEDARVFAAPARAIFRRGADAEQRVEHRAWIAQHRQRLARRRPADRIGVGARVVVFAAA